MKPLIDGDLILYEVGFAAQRKGEDGELSLISVEDVNAKVDLLIKNICAEVYATEEPAIYLTGKGNFRFAAAKSRPYKGNRKQLKPHYYSYIKAYLQSQWGAVIVDGMEADDALCIEQTMRINQRDTIICSRDKDLKQCPGYHYTWECGKQGSWGPKWVDAVGEITLKGPKKLVGTEHKFFYSQLLTGDSTDTYDGLPGTGPIGAYEALKDATTDFEMFSAVLGCYEKKYADNALEKLTEQAYLAWMVRELDEEGNPAMWRAPV